MAKWKYNPRSKTWVRRVKGKKGFVHRKSKPGTASSTKRTKSRKKRSRGKGGGGRVAKNRRFSISLGVAAGLAAGLSAPVKALMGGDYEYALVETGRVFTGFDSRDGSFDVGRLKFGLFPLLIGVAAHMIAAKVGLNRAIGQATRGWPIGITI